MKKRVFFIAPKIANIYLDVIAELERQNYEVDYYEYKSYKNDPHNLKGHRKYGRMFTPVAPFEKMIKNVWERVLNTPPYNKTYDYLFVIDGDSLHPILFSTLKTRNPQIKMINYLFDSTRGNYEFDVHFKFFDKVATFDIADSKRHGIDLLPIYWIQEKGVGTQELDFFGLGAYIPDRFNLFSVLDEYSNKHNLNSFIKIFSPVILNEQKHKWKRRIIELISAKSYMIPLNHYHSKIVTHESMSTSTYRQNILNSKIVLDSNAPEQDGLTARFMWALGAERKIITTNKAIKQYDFYTPEQIFVVEDISSLLNNCHLDNFVHSKYLMPEEIRLKILEFRIDHWIRRLFEN